MSGEESNAKTETAEQLPGIISQIWAPLRRSRNSHEEQIRQTLNETPLFHAIGRHDWKLLSNLFHDRRYQQGETIFERGMPGLGMYVILDGEVEIVGDSEPGSPVLARLGPGDFFGEMAVVQEGVRNATAVAAVPCELIGIFRPQFRELLTDRPRLGALLYERIARILAERLRRTDEQLTCQPRSSAEREP